MNALVSSADTSLLQCVPHDEASPSRQSWQTLHSLYSQSLKDAQLAWDERAAVLAHAFTAGREVATLQKQVAVITEDLLKAQSENLELRKTNSALQSRVLEQDALITELSRMQEDYECVVLRANTAAQEVEHLSQFLAEGSTHQVLPTAPSVELHAVLSQGLHVLDSNASVPPLTTERDVIAAVRDYTARVRQHLEIHKAATTTRTAIATEESVNADLRIVALTNTNTALRRQIDDDRANIEALHNEMAVLQQRDLEHRQQFARVVEALPIDLLHLAREGRDEDRLSAVESWDAAVHAIRDLGLLCVAQEQDALAERNHLVEVTAQHQHELATVLHRMQEAETALQKHLTTRLNIANTQTQTPPKEYRDAASFVNTVVPLPVKEEAPVNVPTAHAGVQTLEVEEPIPYRPRSPPSPQCLAATVTLPLERRRPVVMEPLGCDVSDGAEPQAVEVRIHRATPINRTPPRSTRDASVYRASPATSPPSVQRTAERSFGGGRAAAPSPIRQPRCEACQLQAVPVSSTALFSTADAEAMLSRAATIGAEQLHALGRVAVNTARTAKPTAVRALTSQTSAAGLTQSISRSTSPAVSIASDSRRSASIPLHPKRQQQSRSTSPASSVAGSVDVSMEILAVIAALDRRVESALASTAPPSRRNV